MKRGMWIGKIIVFVVLAVGVFGLATQLLWNWLVPALFNGPVLTYWQTLGLLVLSKILFSGFGGKGGRWGHHHQAGPWRPYWKERLGNMSPEDRERFRQKMKDKWCGWGEDASNASTKDSGASNV
jgi:hypothetical protein